MINERALRCGDGIHPKHSLTKYHNFFTDNILNGENILDVGWVMAQLLFQSLQVKIKV